MKNKITNLKFNNYLKDIHCGCIIEIMEDPEEFQRGIISTKYIKVCQLCNYDTLKIWHIPTWDLAFFKKVYYYEKY